MGLGGIPHDAIRAQAWQMQGRDWDRRGTSFFGCLAAAGWRDKDGGPEIKDKLLRVCFIVHVVFNKAYPLGTDWPRRGGEVVGVGVGCCRDAAFWTLLHGRVRFPQQAKILSKPCCLTSVAPATASPKRRRRQVRPSPKTPPRVQLDYTTTTTTTTARRLQQKRRHSKS